MKTLLTTLFLLLITWSVVGAQQIDKQAYVTNYNAIMRAKGGAETERLFQELLKNFGSYRSGLPAANRDVPLRAVAYAYILEKDTLKANQYISQLSDVPTLSTQLYGLARDAEKTGLSIYAEGLMKKAINSYESLEVKPDPKADPLGLVNNSKKYGVLFYIGYAQVLTKNGKDALALAYAKKAYQLNKEDKLAVKTYGRLLAENKMFTQALPVLEEDILYGSADSAVLSSHKAAYFTLKGKKGYESRLSYLKNKQAENMRSEMKKQMIAESAPDFSLMDLNGKTWTLKELKGKTVVLDFWATWCGPCKKSFPAMEMAVNKYIDDKAVVFLFIHTWERDRNAIEGARKYIEENRYNFNVLMDLKKNGQNEAITAYRASGIPAKFIIDGKGNIRFKLTGFSGTNEAAVEEISAMIELAKDIS